MPLNIGELNQRVLIETVSATRDEMGQSADAWSPLATIWAKVQQQSGRLFLSGDVGAQEKAIFTIRWRDDVNSAARVDWRGRKFRIDATAGTRQSGALALQCTALEGLN